jgi:group I intron endonuclease
MNKNKRNNLIIIPLISYNLKGKSRSVLYNNNKNKSGIYRWTNLINEKSYVGSSINLAIRLKSYFSINQLQRTLSKGNSAISNALLKYGYSNFSLDILEYCEPNIILIREQYYLDLLGPEYNICKKAGSTFGKKHSLETLEKFKKRKRKQSGETILKIKMALKDRVYIHSELRKVNHLYKTGHITKVLNTNNNAVKIYSSIRLAAKSLNVSHATLIKYYVNKDKLFKNNYLITK